MPVYDSSWIDRIRKGWFALVRRGGLEGQTSLITLAAICGLMAGYGAVLFSYLIHYTTEWTFGWANNLAAMDPWWKLALMARALVALATGVSQAPYL